MKYMSSAQHIGQFFNFKTIEWIKWFHLFSAARSRAIKIDFVAPVSFILGGIVGGGGGFKPCPSLLY